ncbi:MAG: acyl carrier protein [Oscillospiraceae bacterium]|nr:acyl carrier protein [Oscillospiraceae bacterium]
MFENLKSFITNYVEVNEDDITLESRFIDDLGFNSYDFMSLLGDIETEFDIMIDESEVLNLHTVGDAVKYIESLKD